MLCPVQSSVNMYVVQFSAVCSAVLCAVVLQQDSSALEMRDPTGAQGDSVQSEYTCETLLHYRGMNSWL